MFFIFEKVARLRATFMCFEGVGEREVVMEKKRDRRSLQQRVRAGDVRKKDVVRKLGELAFGKVNDCVRLALEECPELENLDLGLLSEVKRNEKGMVEIKLIDRLKVLQQLAQVIGDDGENVTALMAAIQGGDGK